MKFTGIEKKKYWEEVSKGGWGIGFWKRRQRHVNTRQFPILTKENLSILTSFLKDKIVLDVGAGCGYLSYHLRKGDINITPIVLNKKDYDFKRNFFKKYLVVSDCLTHDLTGYNVFIISWPDYRGEHACKFLKRLSPGDIVIYQGESEGGCCATDNFFDELAENFRLEKNISDELNDNHVRFLGINDHWDVYIKK